jgi:hypothetical protein
MSDTFVKIDEYATQLRSTGESYQHLRSTRIKTNEAKLALNPILDDLRRSLNAFGSLEENITIPTLERIREQLNLFLKWFDEPSLYVLSRLQNNVTEYTCEIERVVSIHKTTLSEIKRIETSSIEAGRALRAEASNTAENGRVALFGSAGAALFALGLAPFTGGLSVIAAGASAGTSAILLGAGGGLLYDASALRSDTRRTLENLLPTLKSSIEVMTAMTGILNDFVDDLQEYSEARRSPQFIKLRRKAEETKELLGKYITVTRSPNRLLIA